MRKSFRALCVATALAAAFVAAPAGAFELDAKSVELDHPTPWPLENLVKPGKLVIATTAKNQKETFIDTDGTLKGARIELWTKLAEDLGLEAEFVPIDWAGVMPGLAANRFDMGCEGASWTNERLTSKDFFLTRPVKVAVNVAVVRADSEYQTLDDLKEARVGGVKGEVEMKALLTKVGKSEEDALQLPGVAEARLALLNKQIEAYGTGIHAAQALLDGEQGDQLRIINEPTFVGVGGFCVNKNEPDLLTAVNFMMAKYRVDGTITEINAKWGLPDHSDLLTQLGY